MVQLEPVVALFKVFAFTSLFTLSFTSLVFNRSCDGGISMSLRKCLTKTECVGGKVERYATLHMFN